LDLQKALNEPFGKDNIRQSFFSEVKFRHVLVFVFDFIDPRTRKKLKTLSKDEMLLEKILTDYSHINPTPIRGLQQNWKRPVRNTQGLITTVHSSYGPTQI
jgi:hypothetical protein